MTISQVYPNFESYYLISNDRSKKTIKEYHGRLFGRSGFVTTIGDLPIDFLGIDHIVRWKLYLREEGLQAGYINDMLSSLRWFLKWCGENEHNVFDWTKMPWEKEEKDKPKTILAPAEVERLIAAAPTLRDRAIISLFFGSGIRSAEELDLDREQWEAADLVNKECGVWEIYVLGKGSKYRPVLMTSDVKAVVDAYLGTRADRFRPLFISQQNRRVSYHTVNRMVHEAARRAGLTKRVTPHILRHSYVTDKAANGMPLPVLSYNIGHSNAATTAKIYTHINALHARHSFVKALAKPVDTHTHTQ